jgi:hypothetical protein
MLIQPRLREGPKTSLKLAAISPRGWHRMQKWRQIIGISSTSLSVFCNSAEANLGNSKKIWFIDDSLVRCAAKAGNAMQLKFQRGLRRCQGIPYSHRPHL